MMYPESFIDDKGVLNAYENEYGNYYQDPIGLQRVCCIKENSQFCPKCGCYHKSYSVKRCLCLTFTSLMACICFVILALSVTFHVEDMQSGYETVHHFLVLVTNPGSNNTDLPDSNPFDTENNSAEIEASTTTEFPSSVSLDYSTEITEIAEDYAEDSRENYENDSYNEREKRSAEQVSVPHIGSGDSSYKYFNCTSFMSNYSNESSNPSKESKSYEEGESEYLKRFNFCKHLIMDINNKTSRNNVSESNQLSEKPIELAEDSQTSNLHSPLKIEENSLKAHNSDNSEDKLSQKRSYYNYEYPSIVQYPYYDSGASIPNLQGDPDVAPASRASDQNIPYITSGYSRTRFYPPTGPDGSNYAASAKSKYAESVKTSQQLTVANNQIWKPVCFRAENSLNPSSYVCMPMRQFDPSQGHSHYIVSDPFKDCSNGNCDKAQNNLNPPLPTVITPSTVPLDLNRQQPILISPTNSPDIHVPTAISSPNPYFFPTLNGAPIMTHLPYDSRQIPLHSGPGWPYRGPPSSPQVQPPLFYGPSRFPGGFSGYQPLPPQPQLHMLPPQTQADLQNPVICMYMPSRSHQFPVVDGVKEGKNRNVEDYQSSSQSGTPGNSSSHQSFRAGGNNCGADEFACENSNVCIPLAKWCDNHIDCLDASDETSCSCKHRVDKRRICDGYFDCPSGEDELGCFGCDRNSFSCQDWERGREQSTCVPLSKMCDNVVDCINHRDELECALLSDSIVPHKTHFVSYSKGILHRNWKGRWYPACTGPKVTEWAIQACLADAGPLSGDPRIEMTSTEYPGPYIIPNGLEILSLSQMCRDQKVVTYVTCPPVQCGTRVTKPMLDSSVTAREVQLQNSDTMQWRSAGSAVKDEGEDSIKEEYSEDSSKYNQNSVDQQGRMAEYREDGYCKNCNLETKHGDSDWTGLLASKAMEYRTQFEPVEEEDRWTRDADDILGVVGGRRSRPSSWPWLIALYRNGRFHCGGVIINELWVMSAAHCMDKFSKHYFEVQAGMLRRFSFSPQEQTRRVTHVVLHDLYNIYDMQNDLALLRLHSKLKFNRWVRPICLPQEHISQYGPPPGSYCTAVGWGATVEGGADPDDLYEVNVPILPYCKHRADQEGAGLCAGYLHGGHDACQGDSGGPLLCKLPGVEERWYVAGVVSHGEGCARPEEPGVYTRVFLFVDWIKSIVNEQDSLSPAQMSRQDCPGLQCNSGRRCVSLFSICNSKADCLNAEDETFCHENYLQKSSFRADTNKNVSGTDYVPTGRNSTQTTEESYGSKITIHEILRDPYEYQTDQVEGLQDVEGKPVYKNSGSNPSESKTPKDEKVYKLLTSLDYLLRAASPEENDYAAEDVVNGEAKSNDPSGEPQTIMHETTRHSSEYSENQNNDSHTEKTDIGKELVNNSDNKPLKLNPLHEGRKQISEDPKQQIIYQEESEFSTENTYGLAKSDDENGELNEHPHESVFTHSQGSQPTTESDISDKENENDGAGTLSSDSKQLTSTSSTPENGGIISTIPPLEDLKETTINTFQKEDTLLVYELVHQDKNASEKQDVGNKHYVNIPPYLLPILFPNNKTSQTSNTSNTNKTRFKNIDNENEGIHPNAFENDDSIKNNKKEQNYSTSGKGIFVPIEDENEMEVKTISSNYPSDYDKITTPSSWSSTKTEGDNEITNLSTWPYTRKEDDNEITTLSTMPSTSQEDDLKITDEITTSNTWPSTPQENNYEITSFSTVPSVKQENNHETTFNTQSSIPQEDYYEITTLHTERSTLKDNDHETTTFYTSPSIPQEDNHEITTLNTQQNNLQENDHEITTLSTTANDITTFRTWTSTPKETFADSDSQISRGEGDEHGLKDNKNLFGSNNAMRDKKLEPKDLENICKDFIKPKKPESYTEEPKGEPKSNSSDIDKKVHINKDNLDINTGSKDLSNSTSKDVEKVKTESLFVCKRFKQTLLKKRRCDGVVDCEDGTDEMKCSCKERLKQLSPSLVCDGTVQCYDQTDEKHCTNKCNKTEYFCPRSKICIHQTHRCNGVQNCPENEDEENCYALIEDGEVRLNRALVPMFRREGIVAINSVSGWRALCVGLKSGLTAALRGCLALGFRGYDRFQAEEVRNGTLILDPHRSWGNTSNTSVCSGIRVKCSSDKVEKFWMGRLLVEGEVNASVAMIRPHWFLTHSSVCRKLHLESQYAEISMGRNQVSDLGIRGAYEVNRRVDYVTSDYSSFCLLHVETPFLSSRKVRPIKFRSPKETDFTHEFHAVTLSGRGFQMLKLNRSKIYRENDDLCFTITYTPSECYTLGGIRENGFVILTMLYDSYIASTFDSFQIFCTPMTEVCLEKVSTYSSQILGLLDNGQVTPKAIPPCNGIRCGKCVKWDNVSDGEQDCSDGTDETPAAFSKRQQVCRKDPSACGCRADQFQCPSGLCIEKSAYCDGVKNCEDGSDEPPGCEHSCLALLHFAYPYKICDGVRNCFDKSDEKWNVCRDKTCDLKDSFVCKSGKCIPREFVCDNEADCPEGEDEQNCVSILRNSLTEGTLSQQRFGVWSPKCLNDTSLDLKSFCSEMGKSEITTREVITPNRTSVAVDSYSPVKLNSRTSVVVRRGRPLVEVDTSLPCKYLYIKCS